MSTLGQLQTYIAKRLIDPSGTAVATSDITEAVNESIRYWKFRRFWFNEVSDSATLTAGDASLPVPSDFLVPAAKDDGFAIEYGNIRYPMSKITKAQFDSLFITNAQGLPRWYARLADEEYKCYYIPNIDYTIKRHYLKDYQPLVNASDTNDFTDNAERLIKLWTLANITQELRQDSQQASYYREATTNEFKNLQVMTGKANASGKLTLYSNL